MKEPKNSWSELQLKIKDKEYSITLSNAFNPLPALVQMIYNIKNGITPFKIKIDEEVTDKHIEIDSIKDDVYMLCYDPYSDKSENELDIYFELKIEKWIFEKVFANALIHFFKYNYKKKEWEWFDKKALYILKDLSTFKSRIFVVLNRNIHEQYKYTKEEVQAALNKKNFNSMTQREQRIFVKTFKEFDDEDFYQLQIDFDVTLQTLANIFCSSYFYKDTYFRNKWADYFGLEKIEENSKQRVYKPSERVKRILKRRGIT